MNFSELSNSNKLQIVKDEFAILIKRIFERPEILLDFVKENALKKNQVKPILKCINSLNAEECACCRKYDPSRLKLPINQELEPLIDIAQSIAKSRQY